MHKTADVYKRQPLRCLSCDVLFLFPIRLHSAASNFITFYFFLPFREAPLLYELLNFKKKIFIMPSVFSVDLYGPKSG